MTPARPADHHATAVVRGLVTAVLDDARIESFWLEGDDDSIQWPPYRALDLHFAVPEPHLDGVRRDLAALLARADAVTEFSQQQAPLQGWAGSARLSDGSPLSYRIERTSQVAKVPRRAVNILVDRSGGLLLAALSFEPRPRTG